MLELDGRVGGQKVGVVISGGNIDPNLLGKALQQGLASAGRYLAFRATRFLAPDGTGATPDELFAMTQVNAGELGGSRGSMRRRRQSRRHTHVAVGVNSHETVVYSAPGHKVRSGMP